MDTDQLIFTPYLSNAVTTLVLRIVIYRHTDRQIDSQTDRQTDRQTDTQTKYCNPRCACVPRVNYALLAIFTCRHVRDSKTFLNSN